MIENANKIARVFPRRTAASPDDALAFFGPPPAEGLAVDAIHLSVTFTWDWERAQRLAEAWSKIGTVSLGGPALNAFGYDFVPGRYLKQGYVITSRGCPNRCWFCTVWKREGQLVRQLPITQGWNVLDNNLLACTDGHIRAVFRMLRAQSERAQFTGGLEAARLLPWHVDELTRLNPEQIFFAYDEPADYEPLRVAGQMLQAAGFTFRGKKLRCYVLCGYPTDTLTQAEARMHATIAAGCWPTAMLYRDGRREQTPEWVRFQRYWFRPANIYARLREMRSSHLFS